MVSGKGDCGEVECLVSSLKCDKSYSCVLNNSQGVLKLNRSLGLVFN